MTIRLTAALFLLAAAPVAAEVHVTRCIDQPRANIQRLAEPLEQMTRTYADGAVRVILMGSGEPACCGIYIAVLLPDIEGRACYLVAADEIGQGWSDIRWAGEASYDPQTGLAIPLEVDVYEGADLATRPMTLRINQATGQITD